MFERRGVRPAASAGQGTDGSASASPGPPASSGLAGLAPGPELLAALVALPAADRSRAERVEVIAGWERLIAYAQARQLGELAEFAYERPAEPAAAGWTPAQVGEFAADELAPVLGISPASAGARLGLALDLAERLPATQAALAAGALSLPKARAVVEATRGLDVPRARTVEQVVLAGAGGQSYAQLRRALQHAVLAADPPAAERHHQTERDERRVVRTLEPDGMGWLSLYASAEVITAGWNVLTTLARSSADADADADAEAAAAAAAQAATAGAGTAGAAGAGAREAIGRSPERGLDARRADALADLLTAAAVDPLPAAVPPRSRRGAPQVQVIVAVGTLLGLDDSPAELAGYGPIPASMARRIAADGDWQRLLTDPHSGALLAVDPTRYRPPASLSALVLARDRTCRFPGCSRPSADCDLDHTVPHPAGPTSAGNLGPLCRRHHRLKHAGAWRVDQPQPGTFVWIAPSGHSHTVAGGPPGPVHPPPGLPPAGPPAPAPDPPEDDPPF